jgi:hypothetical protein
MNSGEGLLRNATRILERVNEEVGAAAAGGSGSSTPDSDGRVRPLEDPYLVGEVAAARARRERLARENGDDVLHSEDRRWDWFLGKCLPVFLSLVLWTNTTVFAACWSGFKGLTFSLYPHSPDEGLGGARRQLEAVPP